MISILSIIFWGLFYLVGLYLSYLFFKVSHESFKALRRLKRIGFFNDESLKLNEPLSFQCGYSVDPSEVLSAPFADKRALYFHTHIEEFVGRRSNDLLDARYRSPFKLEYKNNLISLPEDDLRVDWVLPSTEAFHGIAGKISARQKERLNSLGVKMNSLLKNPLSAIKVKETLLPYGSDLFVFGKVVAVKPDPDKADSYLQLVDAADVFPPIITTSKKLLERHLGYIQKIFLTATFFTFIGPFFIGWLFRL